LGIAPKAPYLARLGDIGTVVSHKADYLAFPTRQLTQFRAMLLGPGNHEAYHSTWPDTLEILRVFERGCAKYLSGAVRSARPCSPPATRCQRCGLRMQLLFFRSAGESQCGQPWTQRLLSDQPLGCRRPQRGAYAGRCMAQHASYRP
jgi:hypothetical protein